MGLLLWIFVINLSTSCVIGALDTSKSTKLVKATNCFSTSLIPKLKSTDGNLICSPLSVDIAISMLQMGANGSSYAELNKALLYQDNDLSNEDVQNEMQSLLNRLRNFKDVTLNIENSIWIEEEYPIKPSFKQVVSEKFLAKEDNLDFKNNAHNATDTINNWVGEKTNSLIPKLFDDDLSTDTALVIANVIYFKGVWDKPFDVKDTKSLPFRNNNKKAETKLVSLMNQQDQFYYVKDKTLQAQVLVMFYKGAVTKFVAVLPKENVRLEDVEEKLSCGKINEVLKKTVVREVDVTIPKFDLTSSLDLKQPLRDLNVNAIFGEGADLSGMAARGLKVTTIIQKARIKVFEEGSEAAAVTGITEEESSEEESSEKVEQFNADRPFLFYIMEDESDQILFSGKVTNL